MALLLLFAALVTKALAATSACSSLVTYKQYGTLLSSAPNCYRFGCASAALTSMDSICDPDAECYLLWSIIDQQHQKSHNWCDSPVCKTDVACRTTGWPLLNASAVCDALSSTIIARNLSSCCASGSEPAELAVWLETMCNGSFHNTLFRQYDGMAQEDWWDWMLPWNWTVRAANSSTVTVQQPSCEKTSLYFVFFAIEGVAVLLLSFSWHILKLSWIKRDPSSRRCPAIPTGGVAYIFQRLVCEVFHNLPVGVGEILTTLGDASLLVCFQLAANFGSAYLIKSTRGYSHVSAPLLALLFCARPRLGWLFCLTAMLPDRLIERLTGKGLTNLLEGRIKTSNVAIAASVSELIMQLLASYSLGRALGTGLHRRFYSPHSLTKYWKGNQARGIYVGAILWLTCFIVTTLIFTTAAVYYRVSNLLQAARSVNQNTSRNAPLRARRKRRDQGHQESYHASEDSELAELQPMRVQLFEALRVAELAVGQDVYWQGRASKLERAHTYPEATAISLHDERRSSADAVLEHTFTDRPISRDTSNDGSWNSPYDTALHRPHIWEELIPWVLWFGFLIGITSYIAQWIFWANFVKVSGERYWPLTRPQLLLELKICLDSVPPNLHQPARYGL
jgi:hypothetical protein